MIGWIRTLFLPALAAASLVFALVQVVPAGQDAEAAKPPVTPARAPFGNTVAGAGLVEPSSENISIGTHLPGIATEVLIQAGDKVERGQILFRIDDRQMQADLRLKQANLAAAKAELERLEKSPRPEELPVSEAAVGEAEANLAEQADLLERSKRLYATRAIGEEELVRRKQQHRVAEQKLAQAKASYALLKAGAWDQDKEVAKAKVAQAQAALEQVLVEIERLKVTSPVDGEVLQVNVRPGEYVGAPPSQALIVLGAVGEKHIRVDIDEHDIPRFQPGAPARANLRGDQRRTYDLRFVRVEPYVIPKKSLTGDNTERVDTRVLQVIYAVTSDDDDLHVGQQVDVFVDLQTLANTKAR